MSPVIHTNPRQREKPNGVMLLSENSTPFVFNARDDQHAFHHDGLQPGRLNGFTFDPGGAGRSVAITAVADGAASGVRIKVTAAAHGLAVGDIISQTNMRVAAYNDHFMVKAVIDDDNYEVETPFRVAATGTMDRAASLIASANTDGAYQVAWHLTGEANSNNVVIYAGIHVNAVHISATDARCNSGRGANACAMSGGGPLDIAAGDRVSWRLKNATPNVKDFTVWNLTINVWKL